MRKTRSNPILRWLVGARDLLASLSDKVPIAVPIRGFALWQVVITLLVLVGPSWSAEERTHVSDDAQGERRAQEAHENAEANLLALHPERALEFYDLVTKESEVATYLLVGPAEHGKARAFAERFQYSDALEHLEISLKYPQSVSGFGNRIYREDARALRRVWRLARHSSGDSNHRLRVLADRLKRRPVDYARRDAVERLAASEACYVVAQRLTARGDYVAARAYFELASRDRIGYFNAMRSRLARAHLKELEDRSEKRD